MLSGTALAQMAYASAATDPFSPARLQDLLELARKRNTAAGVTGMLLYLRGSFFQVIEGPADLVHGLYETISADQRHHRIRLLLDQQISHRSFADWSMGLARLDAAELDGIEGLNNFFANGSSFFDLEQGEAQALLVGFRGGRWRQALDG